MGKWRSRFRYVGRIGSQFGGNLCYILQRTWFEFTGCAAYISILCWLRYIWFARILRRTRIFDPQSQQTHIATNTVTHNLKGLELWALRAFSGERPKELLRIITAIETVKPASQRILFVGPRAESELFLAQSLRFRKHNIRGLDLISYSPRVDLGDMHAMPYPDQSWDIVVLGWVLAYSESPAVACREVARVARPGAIIAIGAQYHPLTPQQIEQQLGYRPGASIRVDSTAEMLSLFGDSVDQVYFRHDVTGANRDRPGTVLAVFSVK